MKRIVWASIAAVLIGFGVSSKDPLNEAANFLLAGTIPGTSFSIGFWSTMLIVSVALALIYRGIKSAHHRMIVSQMEKNEPSESSALLQEVEFDRSQRAVIAAPKSESII